MTGLPDFNYPAFFAEEELLKKSGHIVLNPARNPKGLRYESYMDISLAMIRASDRMHVLEGFMKSKGALCEIAYAESLGKQVWYLS